MRLLKVSADGSFSLTTFLGNEIPSYAILSHTWEADNQEVTFQDLMDGMGSGKAGYKKVQFCGEQAQKDGLQYFWIDSCCIDKSSSAEFSEAINSMFRWYRNAARCYVYLSDVSTGTHSRSSQLLWKSSFRQSRWFTRGWTLQELLAPLSVEFFSRDGQRIGDKKSLEAQIHEITGISVQALQGNALYRFSVDERMSWAANRETMIKEDKAYSLLGIFNINMPLIYGEGEKNAFRRLQEEIDKIPSVNSSRKAQTREKQVELNKEEHSCLQALRTSEYEQFKDWNPDRVEGTCQWFLQHVHFQKWRQSSSSSLLWVFADPGCGKSVLAKSLIDQELKATESRVTCYFFFKHDNENQKSITTALYALLHQLFSQKQPLIHHAMQHYPAEGNQLPQSFHKLWSILAKAASDPRAGEVVCILDALDECDELGRYQIIDALNAFYKQTSSRRSASQLKFLVTSRPDFNIERRFTELTRSFPTIQLQGEKESEAMSYEMNVVIKWKVSELGRDLELDDSERSTLETGLLSMTHRTYLWLKLILDVIRDEVGTTKRRPKEIISTLPNTVDQAYEVILSKIRDKKRAQKLLSITIAAARPLTLKEMNIALAIEDHHRSYEDLDLENEERFKTTVRHLCGPLVSVIYQKVYLIHQTAKEFLVAKSEAFSGRWEHSLDQVELELLLARTCITYLNFTVFHDDLGEESIYGYATQARRNRSLLSYAACFWASHFRQAERRATMELSRSILDICETQSPRFQNWFGIYWSMKMENLYWPAPRFTNSLMVESYFGHEAVVKLLLETGKAEVDSKDDEYGRTPLSWAAGNGHEAVVKLLLITGKAKVDSKDNDSRTPLSWAARNGHEAVVKLLLITGKAEVDSKDDDGRTPLLLATENGREAVVGLLETEYEEECSGEENVGILEDGPASVEFPALHMTFSEAGAPVTSSGEDGLKQSSRFLDISGHDATTDEDTQSETSHCSSDWCEGLTTESPSEIMDVHERIVAELLESFRNWRVAANTSQSDRTEPSRTGNSSTAGNSSGTTPSSTRRRGNEVFPRGKKRLSEDDELPPSKRGEVDHPPKEGYNRPLACPFAKYDPIRYRKCFGYTSLWNISRLKLHFSREHQIPIHCPRCSQTFKSEDERDSHHLEEPPCQISPPRIWNGITGFQKTQLKKRVSAKKSVVENWNLIYNILFPGSPLPDSPYVENAGLSTEVLAMREWFHQEAPRVVERAELPPELQQNPPQMRSFLRGVLSDMFDRLLDGWERPSALATQTPRPQSSRPNIPESTPAERAINNTPLTLPSTGAGAASTEPPPSPTSRPRSYPFPSSEPLRALQSMGDIDQQQEQDGNVPQGFDTEAIEEQFPAVSEISELDGSFQPWPLEPSQEEFEISMFEYGPEPDYFETNWGVSMAGSSSAGARA